MGRIEDLGLVVDKGLEWKQRAVDAEAERDQLSAEVESVKKKISVMGGEWMAEAIRAVVAEEKLDAATARAEAADKDAEIARSSSAEIMAQYERLTQLCKSTEERERDLLSQVHILRDSMRWIVNVAETTKQMENEALSALDLTEDQ